MQLTHLVLSLTFLLVSPLALAYGTVNNDKSQITFVTINNGDEAETHAFKRIGGKVDGVGNAEVWIDLTSVDTNVADRDESMKKVLFETGRYPKAVISVRISEHKRFDSLDEFGVGEQMVEDFYGQLNLHGITQEIKGRAIVTRAGVNKIKVASMQPIIIRAKDFNLGPGVEKLREMANLKSISDAVPVSFVLTFDVIGPY